MSLRPIDHELLAKVHYDQLDRLCKRMAGGTAGAMAFSVVMALYLAENVGKAIWLWLALKAVVAAARLGFAFLWHKKRHSPVPLDRWLMVLRSMLLVDGLVLGGVGLLSFHAADPTGALLWTSAVMCGIAAVAISTLESDWIASLCYCAPMMAQTAAYLLLQGTSFGESTGLGILIYGTVLLLNARKASRDEEQRLVQSHTIRQYQIQNEEALELARQESTVRSEFISSVTHELRTPLHGILGLTQQVMKEAKGVSPSMVHAARMIQRSGEHLMGLINDVLDTGKFEAKGVVLHPEVFDVNDVVADVESMSFMIAREKGVALAVSNDLKQPYYVHADPGRLRQIVLNLIGNGIKFTDRGGKIQVSVNLLPNDKTIEFVVADNGIGIPADKLEKIFEPFAQVSTERSVAGSGLGLSITRRLTAAMNGTIEVQSAFGSGSTFSVRIPLERVVVSTHHKPGSVAGHHAETQRLEGHILLAEDDEVTTLLAITALENTGLQVSHVRGGHGVLARAALAHGRPDIILMDCQMPGLDGFAAAREIRAYEKANGAPRIPIIAVTGHSSAEDISRTVEAGMDDHLTKPFDTTELIKIVARHLQQRSSRGSGGAGHRIKLSRKA